MPPLLLHFTQAIVNVKWGPIGGMFVMGDQWGYSAAVEKKAKDTPHKTTELGIMDFGVDPNDGVVMGSSYRLVDKPDEEGKIQSKPVFLLCGVRDEFDQGPISGSNRLGIIMASRDGLSWERVFTLLNESEGGAVTPIRGAAQIMGLVWDDNSKAFYACGHVLKSYFNQRIDPPSLAVPDPVPVDYTERVEEIDVLMSSADGFSWSEAGRNVFVAFTNYGGLNPISYPYPEPLGYGLMLPHCPDRDGLKDFYGNDFQDGVVYYWKDPDSKSKSTILISSMGEIPSIDYPGGGLRRAEATSNFLNIKETDAEGNERTTVVDVGIPIQAVGAAGNVIVAVGGTYGSGVDINGPVDFAVSADSSNWKKWDTDTYNGGPPALTVAGAPLKDLKAKDEEEGG